jgi:serine/threonine protein kinase/WD40 repeat protein
MSEPNQSLEEFLFEAALTKPSAEERAAFLDGVCRDNPGLRARLEVLLEGHFQAEGFLSSGTKQVEQKSAPPAAEESGSTLIGRYKLLEKIGEGGFGEVWMAEQKEPVKRRVALKIIKLGMDTKQVVARFEAERQALALMDHPNIAKVFDAGATDTGRPYFVMELVRGIRITDYCDQNHLPTEERLKLFIQVCRAIQHAHQKGIIHRDIKPSNILVTLHDGVPVPKVIDFGIAKATQMELTDKTVFTQFHQFLGTPAYVSPEQASMSSLDVDTRSDIYSLGVLLYELLTGTTPFDTQELLKAGLEGMRQIICERQPIRPSTRLNRALASSPSGDFGQSKIENRKSKISSDLDWIVMKCLEKDRARRYETANGLARDLQRHLNNEPVVARPPSGLYEFQKSLRRHWMGFAAVAAVLSALAIGLAVSTLEAVRARRAEQEQSRLRYASDMSVAAQALDEKNLGRALDLLNRQRPEAGHEDLRGWEWRYLWRQTRSDALFTLCHESSEINSLATSPDGNWLAIGAYHEGGVSVRDLRTRQELVRLAKKEAHVLAAFSPTQPLLAFAGYAFLSPGEGRNTLRLWNTATRRIVAELPLESKCVGMVFSKDGRTLLTSTSTGGEGYITTWRMPEGTRLASRRSEQVYEDMGTGFAATPDLSLAAYGLAGGRVRVVNLRNGQDLWTALGTQVRVTALAFSPDSKILACGGGYMDTNKNIRLWNAVTGTKIGELEGHGFWVGSLVFWPDGTKLASSSADQTLRIWDVASQKCLNVLRGHIQEVWRLALLPDNKTLVSGAKDGAICFWDASVTHPRQPCIAIPENTAAWCFTPDSRSVLTVNPQGRVSRWTGSDFQQQDPVVEKGTNFDDVAYRFSQDGGFLAFCSPKGGLGIWDISRRVLYPGPTNVLWAVPRTFLAGGHKLIAQSANDNLFHELDVRAGSEIRSWQGPALDQLSDVALSPDESSYVTIDYDEGVIVKNLADNSKANVDLSFWEGLGGSFSADGRVFAVGSAMGYARVWDAATWRPVATFGGSFGSVSSACFSPDGKRLATCVANAPSDMVRLWDMDSWQEVFALDSRFGALIGVAFSPDGNTIGTTEYDGSVHRTYLWRAPSWAEIEAAEKEQAANSETKSN